MTESLTCASPAPALDLEELSRIMGVVRAIGPIPLPAEILLSPKDMARHQGARRHDQRAAGRPRAGHLRRAGWRWAQLPRLDKMSRALRSTAHLSALLRAAASCAPQVKPVILSMVARGATDARRQAD